MIATRWLAAAALALVAVGCASRPDLSGLDLDGWRAIRSSHAEILGDVPPAELEGLADDLDVFVAVAERMTGASAGSSRVSTRIFLVTDKTARRLGVEGVAGFMTRRLDGYHSLVRVVGSHSYATREILFHEYTHALLLRDEALDYPLWYHEGLADVLSTVRRREDSIEVGSAPAHRALRIAQQRRLDLATIFGPQAYSQIRDLGLFYAGAWAVVHYLSSNEERGQQLEQFLKQLARGTPWRQAYAGSFDVPIDELAQRVRAHAEGLARGAAFPLAWLDAQTLAIEHERESRAVEPGQAACDLGEFLLRIDEGSGRAARRGRAFARELFERALSLDPDHASARAGLALCRALAGELGPARDEAERALATGAGDARVQTLVGETHAARLRAAEADGDSAAAREARSAARAAFQRATELAPDDPAAWAGIGTTYLGVDGDVQPGIAALEHARGLGAWDAAPNLALGRLYAAAGNPARARERLREVARLARGEDAKEAERLLAELDRAAASRPASPSSR